MKFFSKIGFIALALSTMVLSSCLKEDQYPEIPEIAYKEFVVNADSSAVLSITFTDGDGDLGVPEKTDTTATDNNNLFLKFLEKQNGVFVEKVSSIGFNYRIPVLNKKDKEKALIGEIRVALEPWYFDPFSPYDTIKYEVYMVDQANHESNRVSTPEIIVPR